MAKIRSDVQTGLSQHRGVVTFGSKKVLEALSAQLASDEQALDVILGADGNQVGALALTSRRVIAVYGYAGIGGRTRVQDISLARVSSVSSEASATVAYIEVHGGGHSLEFRANASAHGQEWAQAARAAVHRATAPAAASASDVPASAAAGVPNPDPIEALRRLAELKDAGAVSEAEYEAKKQELMRRI